MLTFRRIQLYTCSIWYCQSSWCTAVHRQATTNSRREWQYHMLHVYNCILLKMSTWGSKHVEEYNILWMNNSQCIKLVINTGCHKRNGPNFGRVFLMLNYTDITQNTYIQSWTVTEIMDREKCGHLAFPRNVRLQLCTALNVRLCRHKLRPTR